MVDLGTGATLMSVADMRDAVWSVAFSDDGRSLVTGGSDGAMLVWNAPPVPLAAATKPAEANELAALWDGLADPDTASAYCAAHRLVLEESAVAFLKGRLLACGNAPDANAEDLAKLLADLDHDNFRVRDEASRRLADEASLDFLSGALAQPRSEEVRLRLAAVIVDMARRGVKDPQDLRIVRAVRVIELIGTGPAREALTQLAAGSPSRLTREAAASLERMKPSARTPSTTQKQ
jgi:hypothetical protein